MSNRWLCIRLLFNMSHRWLCITSFPKTMIYCTVVHFDWNPTRLPPSKRLPNTPKHPFPIFPPSNSVLYPHQRLPNMDYHPYAASTATYKVWFPETRSPSMNLFILLEYLVLLLLCLVIITLIHFSVPIEQFFVIISQPCLFKCCNNQLVPKYVYHNRVCIDVAIIWKEK